MQPFLRPTILLVVFITLKYFIVHVFVFVGTQEPDFIPEVGEDAVDAVPCSPCMALTEKEQAELCSELSKVGILQSSYISDSSLSLQRLCSHSMAEILSGPSVVDSQG